MNITQSGAQPSIQGPADYFTGAVRIDFLFTPQEPARTSGAAVTFEPGAHTAWQTHPLGQTLFVTAGCGQVQLWGAPVQTLRPGDVVSIMPGEKHWHGATASCGITHIAIQEELEGSAARWLEHVSADQYQAKSSPAALRCLDIQSCCTVNSASFQTIDPQSERSSRCKKS
jgi:quercetin dioxygenase-like cupin family protein